MPAVQPVGRRGGRRGGAAGRRAPRAGAHARRRARRAVRARAQGRRAVQPLRRCAPGAPIRARTRTPAPAPAGKESVVHAPAHPATARAAARLAGLLQPCVRLMRWSSWAAGAHACSGAAAPLPTPAHDRVNQGTWKDSLDCVSAQTRSRDMLAARAGGGARARGGGGRARGGRAAGRPGGAPAGGRRHQVRRLPLLGGVAPRLRARRERRRAGAAGAPARRLAPPAGALRRGPGSQRAGRRLALPAAPAGFAPACIPGTCRRVGFWTDSVDTAAARRAKGPSAESQKKLPLSAFPGPEPSRLLGW